MRWSGRTRAWARPGIAAIPQLPATAALVFTCDKLHNLSCLLADLDREGPAPLQRFNQPEGLAWYYASLAQALSPFEAIAPVRKLQDMAQLFAGQLRDHAPARRARP